MARLPKDIVVVSKPVRRFPNGDFFYMELCRKNSRYECIVRMTSSVNSDGTVIMARGQGKTIREAELNCFETALERCPRFPQPPYFRRGERTRRVVAGFPTAAVMDVEEVEAGILEPVR